jgi:hypothetical protein
MEDGSADQSLVHVRNAPAGWLNGFAFNERASAPSELLPGLIGAVSSSVRFTSFVRDTELRGLVIDVDPDCVIELPVGALAKHPGSLAEIFTGLKCPVVHLGFLAGHRQSWENRGTHLGEVVHSIALGPGESRNIAFVNWRRRQLTNLEEKSTTDERLTAVFVQNRALEEITTAVATEHQEGETQAEAGTAVTAGSFVGAGAIVGGVAGGVIGTLVEPGGGTAIGALAGGAAGSIAGGVIYSGSKALGMIEAQTDGDRDIVADVHQRIALSTSQTASAVRSLWSTAVVEDAQAESVTATTSNITNYNHMHSLNLEYFEVLQHYQVKLTAERLQPLLYLPFTFLDFNGFRFIRDYWDVIRAHLDDEALREQGDSYFVTESKPEAPDLLPVPPVPSPPDDDPEPLKITDLVIDVLFDSIAFNTNVNLVVMKGNQEIHGTEAENGVQSTRLDGYDFGNRYTFGTIEDAQEITAVALSRNQTAAGDMPFRVRIGGGRLRRGSSQLANMSGDVISSNTTVLSSEPTTRTIPWIPGAGFDADNAAAVEEYNEALRQRAIVIGKNRARQAAYEALVEHLERFELRLQKVILRRRHFFTRVILDAIEPEEISQLLESVTIGHSETDGARIRLSDVAHTIPLGLTAGAFVLKLKRLNPEEAQRLLDALQLAKVPDELATLIGYADKILDSFASRREQLTRTDDIYVPTGGLFAEAILGRSNSAEYLDMRRYFNWQDSPIPHQPPAIDPVSTASRFQRGEVSVTVPEGDLQLINPVSFPDPTGLQGVLAAIQNGNIFRDMSGATQLAGVLGNLSALAGQIGQAASTMTGQAAQDATRAASDVSQAAAGLAQTLAAIPVSSGPPSTITNDGAALNASQDLDAQTVAALTPPGQTPPPAEPSPTTSDIPRNVAGLPPAAPRPASRRRNPTLHVSLLVRAPNGRELHHGTLADVRKIFRLFHEQEEPQVHELRSESQPDGDPFLDADPFYVLPVQWTRLSAKLTVALEVEGLPQFINSVQLSIPEGAIAMDIIAQFAGEPLTITRQENEIQADAEARTISGKFGASADFMKDMLHVSGEIGRSDTDTNTTTTGESETTTRTILVPVEGLLNLNVTFRDA